MEIESNVESKIDEKESKEWPLNKRNKRLEKKNWTFRVYD